MYDVKSTNTNSLDVACNGKNAPFDHPKVYLRIDPAHGSICCPYCNKKFTFSQSIDQKK